MLCRNCGHISTDAGVGFKCLDCDKEGDTDETGTRVVWRYRTTEAGIAHVKSGVALPKGFGDPALDRLETFVSREKAAGRPFCMLVCRLTQACSTSRRMALLAVASLPWLGVELLRADAAFTKISKAVWVWKDRILAPDDLAGFCERYQFGVLFLYLTPQAGEAFAIESG
jgi:hypothetical protein